MNEAHPYCPCFRRATAATFLPTLLVLPPDLPAQSLLRYPESMVFDEARDRYLISNCRTGDIIARDPEGVQTGFVDSGQAPMGLPKSREVHRTR